MPALPDRVDVAVGGAGYCGLGAALELRRHGAGVELSRDVGRHGISVNCLAPGRIHSEQVE